MVVDDVVLALYCENWQKFSSTQFVWHFGNFATLEGHFGKIPLNIK